MKLSLLTATVLFSAGLAGLAEAGTGPAPCEFAGGKGPAMLAECFGAPTSEDRRGRGRGKDDGPGHTGLTLPSDPVKMARRGRGKDDPAGHDRRGRGKDDPIGHG